MHYGRTHYGHSLLTYSLVLVLPILGVRRAIVSRGERERKGCCCCTCTSSISRRYSLPATRYLLLATGYPYCLLPAARHSPLAVHLLSATNLTD